MTIMLYRLYPQATPEQKPPGRGETSVHSRNTLKERTRRFGDVVHMAESVTDVVDMVMSLADVALACERTVP